MIEWIWNSLVAFALGWVPWWAWLIVAGLLLGWAWKTFGWQGIVGAAVAILSLGIYRQGWRDGRAGREPMEHLRPTDRDAAPIETRGRPSKSILGGSLKDLFKPGGKR